MLSSRLSVFPSFRGFVRLPQIRCMTVSHHDEIEKEIERIQNLPAEEKAKLDERARRRLSRGGPGERVLRPRSTWPEVEEPGRYISLAFLCPCSTCRANEFSCRGVSFEELAELGMSI
jgi:hypothetical protein